jgi:hypothetical protein
MSRPVFDNSQAILEGWSIFDCDGSSNGRWQLQKCDDLNVFADDLFAWRFVVEQARLGSTYHEMTLLFLKQFNRDEYETIIATVDRKAVA